MGFKIPSNPTILQFHEFRRSWLLSTLFLRPCPVSTSTFPCKRVIYRNTLSAFGGTDRAERPVWKLVLRRILNGCPMAMLQPACGQGFLAAEQGSEQAAIIPSRLSAQRQPRRPAPVALPLLTPCLLSGDSFCVERLFRLIAPGCHFSFRFPPGSAFPLTHKICSCLMNSASGLHGRKE